MTTPNKTRPPPPAAYRTIITPSADSKLPLATWTIPEALRSTELGLGSLRTCHPWVMDRLLAWCGVHRLELADGIVSVPDGRYLRVVVEGDVMELRDAR